MDTKPVIVVPPEDYWALESFQLPVRVATFECSDSSTEPPHKEIANSAQLDHDMLPWVVGCIALSKAGEKQLEEFSIDWPSRFGIAFPSCWMPGERSKIEYRSEIVLWIFQNLSMAYLQQARRNTGYMRELSLLRRDYEELQTSFRKLEHFIYEHGLQRREPILTLAPVSGTKSVRMASGDNLRQRIAGSSVGFSDVAIFIITDPNLHCGLLMCSLFSPDTSETIAAWEVPAEKIESGWLRLAIDKALGTDPISLILNLTWQGDSSIELASSIAHPDEVYRPTLNGSELKHIIAIKTWSGIPNTRIPPLSESVLPALKKGDVKIISGEALEFAANSSLNATNIDYDKVNLALVVHVNANRISAAVLRNGALAGTRRVSSTLMTRNELGPKIEYAIAVAPTSRRPSSLNELPTFEDIAHSGWILANAMEYSQANLVLQDPLPEDCDIYLMTRLPPGKQEDAYGWSSFSEIKIWL